jgi:hypothetical protein
VPGLLHRVDAATQAGLLGLLDDAVELGWTLVELGWTLR